MPEVDIFAGLTPPGATTAQGSPVDIFADLTPPPSATRNIPIANYPEIQREMAREGLNIAGAGYRLAKQQPGGLSFANLGRGALGMAGGALEYAGSPIWAAYRSAIGEPTERLSRGYIPKEYPEFAAQLATPGLGLLRTAAQAAVRPVMQAPRTPLLQAAREENIALPRAVSSESPLVQAGGKVIENFPLFGQPVRTASTQAIEQLGERAAAARDLLGSGVPIAAGGRVREGIESTLEAGPMQRRIGALYNRVDNMVDPAALGQMPETRQLALDLEGRRAAAGLPRGLVNQRLDEILGRGGITYQGIKDLRTHFGEMLQGKTAIPEGMSRTEIDRVYGALSTDLRGVVAANGGPDALRVWEKANAMAARWAQTRAQLANVLKTNTDEGIVDKMHAMMMEKGGNLEQLLRIRNSIPADHWDEFSSAVIGRMGWRPGGTGFSPDTFLTEYNKLSPQARGLVFGNQVAPIIDNIATMSQRYKQLQAFANPSGTGRVVSMWETLLHPILALKAAVPGVVMGQYLARPETGAMLRNWVNAQAGPVGMRQMATRVLAADMARGTGTEPQAIIDQMQGRRQ